jgi:hypothetical protein
MKSVLLLVAMLLACATARAETITLGSEPCTATKICYSVPNNAGVSVEYISDATQYGRLLISIDGDLYDSGLWTYPNLANTTLYDPLGSPLQVSIDITVVQKPCVRSGRGTSCPKVVTLNGGTLTRP